MLSQLLDCLSRQETSGLFTYSILVVDNDSDMSAKAVVGEYQEKVSIEIDYHVEAVKGIPVARNKAIAEARGDLLAFIDDDEFPNEDWLLRLFKAIIQYQASGVIGPVKPYFIVPPPHWIVKSGLFERPTFKTGTTLKWSDTRTGNVLIASRIFDDRSNLFNPEIGHGEDKDFFKRMIAKGHSFVWCDEAIVHEVEPRERLKRSYFLKRALVRGSYYFARATNKPLQIIRSVLTMGVYCAVLPILSLFGQHIFMKSLIRIFDHAGCLIGACGIRPDKYFEHM